MPYLEGALVWTSRGDGRERREQDKKIQKAGTHLLYIFKSDSLNSLYNGHLKTLPILEEKICIVFSANVVCSVPYPRIIMEWWRMLNLYKIPLYIVVFSPLIAVKKQLMPLWYVYCCSFSQIKKHIFCSWHQREHGIKSYFHAPHLRTSLSWPALLWRIN